MQVKTREIKSKNILTPQKAGSLSNSYDYSLNPYAGCAFACSYCYVPTFPNAEHDVNEWGSWVNVKVNAPELIVRDRLKVFGSKIFFSFATDPYQYIELKYQLTRRCLEELLKYKPAKLTLHTRSHLMLRDLDLLKAFGDRLNVGVSVTTDNEKVRRAFEPNAPSIRRRIQLISKLKDAGINVHASLAPLLPCRPSRLVALLEPLVDNIWIDEMRYLDIMRRPELLEEYSWFFDDAKYALLISKIRERFRDRRNSQSRKAKQTTAQSKSITTTQLQLALG